MTSRTRTNAYGRFFYSLLVAAGMSALGVGCSSIPGAISRPIQAVGKLPLKLVGRNNDDAKLKEQAKRDPFPTRSEAAAQIATRVR